MLLGRHIMMGYMHQEDKTNETIDKEGWCASSWSINVARVIEGSISGMISALESRN